VAADHPGELVGLALQGQLGTLDLLVVLELELEQLHHLDGGPGGPGDRHTGVAVGREHLFHRAVADEVAGGRPAVAGHDHTVDATDGHHGGAVGDLVGLELPG
jgi:hypothetical protein